MGSAGVVEIAVSVLAVFTDGSDVRLLPRCGR